MTLCIGMGKLIISAKDALGLPFRDIFERLTRSSNKHRTGQEGSG
jgi:hypothetical protein